MGYSSMVASVGIVWIHPLNKEIEEETPFKRFWDFFPQFSIIDWFLKLIS